MPLTVKICGLRTAETIDAAIEAGADMVGFVLFPPSPRHVGFDEARILARHVAGRAQKVVLTVNADDALMDAAVEAIQPDILQLHGQEDAARAAHLRARHGRAVMKALGVSTAADLDAAQAWAGACDHLLFDAKPPKDATRPGGNGLAFDWTLLAGRRFDRPWLLSGGLRLSNVAEALRASGAPGVDLSSGVESAPGVKDPALIAAFVQAARAAADPVPEGPRP